MNDAALISPVSTLQLPERSLLGKRWAFRDIDERHCRALCQRHGLPEIVSRLLCHRGVTLDDAPHYLAPSLRALLPNPFHLKDMAKAAMRLADAVEAKACVGIFGDYDVDGATSSALLIRTLGALGCQTLLHIPDRQKEGYGPNIAGLKRLQAQGASLVITVDTGTVAFEPLKQAKAAGIDLLVIDHHQGEAALPDAYAIVNPNRLDEESAFGHLAACGVTFLFLVALHRTLRERGFFATRAEPDLLQLLDLVALGTVCDVVPLTGLNRAFVVQGLKIMRQRRNLGIAALMDIAGLEEAPTPYHLGYIIGPRINAGGRVGRSDLGAQLLTTDDPVEARQLAEQLDLHNRERKAIESDVLDAAMQQAARQANRPIILVASDGWHEGVIGIVAGRLKEKYERPIAVIALRDGVGKASARSVRGIDIGQLVTAARQAGLLEKGGGHAMAAGFTVREDRLDALQEFLERRMAAMPVEGEAALSIDGHLPVSGITSDLAILLEQAGPFGAGNATPRYLVPEVRIVSADVLGEKHLRCMVAEAGVGGSASPMRLKAMGFGMADSDFGQQLLRAQGRRMHLVGRLKADMWRGRAGVSLLIEDAAFC